MDDIAPAAQDPDDCTFFCESDVEFRLDPHGAPLQRGFLSLRGIPLAHEAAHFAFDDALSFIIADLAVLESPGGFRTVTAQCNTVTDLTTMGVREIRIYVNEPFFTGVAGMRLVGDKLERFWYSDVRMAPNPSFAAADPEQ